MKKKPKPNFLIIGAAKAATTSLSSLLANHPEAAIVPGKEPQFFAYDDRYRLGFRRYLKLFSQYDKAKAIGDASTAYSRIRYHPQTIGRIKEHLPKVKIIYMVRHPLERMESAYVEHMGTGDSATFGSINDAVKRHPRVIIDSSRYWEVYYAYQTAFSDARIKIVWFEEYVANTTAIFQDVCRFLKIDDTIQPNFKSELTNPRDNARERMKQLGRNPNAVDLNWEDETRKWVIDQLQEDNCRFLHYFAKPRNYWGDLFQDCGLSPATLPSPSRSAIPVAQAISSEALPGGFIQE